MILDHPTDEFLYLNCFGFWMKDGFSRIDCNQCRLHDKCKIEAKEDAEDRARANAEGRSSGFSKDERLKIKDRNNYLDALLALLDPVSAENDGETGCAANEPSHAKSACEGTESPASDHHPAVGSGAPVAPPVTSACPEAPNKGQDYAIPAYSMLEDLRAESTDNLLQALKACVAHPRYLEVRDHYCAINTVLNERFDEAPKGILSPCFRPRRKAPPPKSIKGEYPLAHKQLSNDTQVLDLHWLFCRGVFCSDSDDKLIRAAMDGSDFGFEAASKFAATRGAINNKLSYMNLGNDGQWQLASLQSAVVRAKLKELMSAQSKIRKDLRLLGRCDQYIRGQEDCWSWIWAAKNIEQSIIGDGKAPAHGRIAKWYQLLTGEHIKRQSVGRKLHALRTRINPS